MEQKGFLTAGGKVTQDHTRGDIVGSISYKETRYNLRRVLVSREWIVTLNDGQRFYGETRREAVWCAMNRKNCA